MPGARSLSSAQLSSREARWLAIAAQGLGAPRAVTTGDRRTTGVKRTAAKTRAQLLGVMDQLGTIQLDAVNVLARTQFLVPFSRLGPYDPAVLRSLSEPQGSWFEYWGHAASLLPVELQPLFRWRMQRWRDDLVDSAAAQERRRAWRAAHSAYIAYVLAEVTERGPLAASQLSDPRRQTGEWWDRRSTGRRALELLFGDGVLSAWRSPNFERIYDLTERVVPAAVLEMPTPADEDAQKQLIALAARCLGVATEADLADYFWLRPQRARLLVAELVGEGRLVQVAVEGWPQPGYIMPGVRPKAPKRATATLVSPFDSLIWTRPRAATALRVPLPHRDLCPRAAPNARLLRHAVATGGRTSRPLGPEVRSEGRCLVGRGSLRRTGAGDRCGGRGGLGRAAQPSGMARAIEPAGRS